MKRGPQPKRVFDAAQSRARAAKIRELMAVMKNSKLRGGMEMLAKKFEQRADKLEAGAIAVDMKSAVHAPLMS